MNITIVGVNEEAQLPGCLYNGPACTAPAPVTVGLTMQEVPPVQPTFLGANVLAQYVNQGANYYGGSIGGSVQSSCGLPSPTFPLPFLDQQGYVGFPSPLAGCSIACGGFLENITYGSTLGVATTLLALDQSFFGAGQCFLLLTYILDLQTAGQTSFVDLTSDTLVIKNIVPPFVNVSLNPVGFICADNDFIGGAFTIYVGRCSGANPSNYSPLTGGFAFFPGVWTESAGIISLYGQFAPFDNNPGIVPFTCDSSIPCYCTDLSRVYNVTLSGCNVAALDGTYPVYWTGLPIGIGGEVNGDQKPVWACSYVVDGFFLTLITQLTESGIGLNLIYGGPVNAQGSGTGTVLTCDPFTASGMFSGPLFGPPNPLNGNFFMS